MCCIFNCFGWALDVVQRIITFIFACILCSALSIGLLVAVGAGVAYGYNYCMAEYLTFTRTSTNVYMRRGQFMDKQEIDKDRSTDEIFDSRRLIKEGDWTNMNAYMRQRAQFLDEEESNKNRNSDDLLDSRRLINKEGDYAEDAPPEAGVRSIKSYESEEILASGMNENTNYDDTNSKEKIMAMEYAKAPPYPWGQSEDTRNYAEVLTKYSSKKKKEEELVPEQYKISSTPPATPSPIFPTTLLQTSTAQIFMRQFQTVDLFSYLEKTTMQRKDNFLYYQDAEELPDKSTEEPNVLIRTQSPILNMFDDTYRRTHLIPMRHWDPDTFNRKEMQYDVYANVDDADVNEDNLVYKMKSV